jgi:hypothetical protein
MAKYSAEKYLKKYTLSKVSHKPWESHFWSILMKAKELFLRCGVFTLKMVNKLGFGKISG